MQMYPAACSPMQTLHMCPVTPPPASVSIVRELHVYGSAVAVSARAEAGGGAHQHMG